MRTFAGRVLTGENFTAANVAPKVAARWLCRRQNLNAHLRTGSFAPDEWGAHWTLHQRIAMTSRCRGRSDGSGGCGMEMCASDGGGNVSQSVQTGHAKRAKGNTSKEILAAL